jgi:hypothetical protein
MSTVEVSKPAGTFITVTRTKTDSVVSEPADRLLEVHDPGVAGPPNVLTVGTVTSGTPAVTITGVAPSQVLNFVLPISGSYIHTQSVSASTWTINHNLGFNPAVSIVDSGEIVVIGDVTYISTNTLSVSFNASFGGKAYLS